MDAEDIEYMRKLMQKRQVSGVDSTSNITIQRKFDLKNDDEKSLIGSTLQGCLSSQPAQRRITPNYIEKLNIRIIGSQADDECDAAIVQKLQPDKDVAAYVLPKPNSTIVVIPLSIISVEEFYGIICVQKSPGVTEDDANVSTPLLEQLNKCMSNANLQKKYRPQTKVGE